MTDEEKRLLAQYREYGTLTQAQAIEYHALLKKEEADAIPVAEVPVPEEIPADVIVGEPPVEAPKKRGRKKKV